VRWPGSLSAFKREKEAGTEGHKGDGRQCSKTVQGPNRDGGDNAKKMERDR